MTKKREAEFKKKKKKKRKERKSFFASSLSVCFETNWMKNEMRETTTDRLLTGSKFSQFNRVDVRDARSPVGTRSTAYDAVQRECEGKGIDQWGCVSAEADTRLLTIPLTLEQ